MSDAAPLRVVPGIEALSGADGPLFAVVGVFDGLHLGHRYLLERLVAASHERAARPAVITFDSHPDEVIVGHAPPLLLDPADRLRLLAAAGIEVTVVQHFDAELRRTPYDAFVRRIADRTRLAGLLMTPDAAFGHERRGTPDALAALGSTFDPPFEVVVVPPFTLDGRPVSSSEIRRLVAAGELEAAARLLGRDYAVVGEAGDGGAVSFRMPVALPPPGRYSVLAGREPSYGLRPAAAEVGADSLALLDPPAADGRVRVVFG